MSILAASDGHLLSSSSGILESTDAPTYIEAWQNDFSSGDFSEFNTPTAWNPPISTNTIVSDGIGGYHYVAHAQSNISEGTPGKAYASRDFSALVQLGGTIRIVQTFSFVTPISGDGNLFTMDCENRSGVGPGIRLSIDTSGQIKVNCTKIARPDILPEYPHQVIQGQVHTLDWTFVSGRPGYSRLLLDGGVVHDGQYDTQPSLVDGDVLYEYVQFGITANSHSTEKEMLVYETAFYIT